MQRVTASGLIPDLLPAIEPTVDLSVKLASSEKTLTASSIADPADLRNMPTLLARVPHAGEKLYTLLLLDPGQP